MSFYNEQPTALKTTAQNLTANWVDIGAEIQTKDYKKLALYIDLNINDSANARVRILAKTSYGGTNEYVLPIKTVGTTDVKLDAEYYEFNTDSDQKMVMSWDTENLIPVVQVQIQAGTVGASAGQIESIYYALGN